MRVPPSLSEMLRRACLLSSQCPFYIALANHKPFFFLLFAMPCYGIFPDSAFLWVPVLLATYPGAQTMSTAFFARYQASQGYLGISDR